MKRILLLADSLSGTGHQRRAELLARALLQRGYGVTYLSHALYDGTLEALPAFRYVDLPTYAGLVADPKALAAAKMERLRRITRLRHDDGPFAALIFEHYPLGKLYLDEEATLLRRFFRGPETRQICIYRDIVDDGDLAQAEAGIARLNAHFDALLLLADPALQAPPPQLAALRIPVMSLGLLDPRERRRVLVFGGGGLLNERFYRAALLALMRLAQDPSLDFVPEGRIYTGSLMPEAAFAGLAAIAAGYAGRVELLRSAPDLYAELGQAAVTVSTLGYNTFVELLHFNNANLIVPLAHNDEQRTRARLLAQLKPNVTIIDTSTDTSTDTGTDTGGEARTDTLADALAAALAHALKGTPAMGGLRRFVQAVEALCGPPEEA